jgi:hypothetical protein
MECFICLNEIDQSQNIFYLKCCNNYLHDDCIKSWLNHTKKPHSNKCPYCTKINHDFGSLLCRDIDIIIIDNNYSNTNIENIDNNNYSFLCSFTIIMFIIFIVLFFPLFLF